MPVTLDPRELDPPSPRTVTLDPATLDAPVQPKPAPKSVFYTSPFGALSPREMTKPEASPEQQAEVRESVLEYTPVRGIPQAGRGVKNLVTGEGGRLNAASDVIEGVGKTLAPAALPALAVAPVGMAAGLGAGIAAQQGTEAGMTALGASPEASRFAGNVAGSLPIIGAGARASRGVRGWMRGPVEPVAPRPVEIPPVPDPVTVTPTPEPVKPMNRAQRRASVMPPETGIPENVARAMDARQRVAEQVAGKRWEDLSNSERLIVDDLIAEGQGTAVPTAPPDALPVSDPTIKQPSPAPKRTLTREEVNARIAEENRAARQKAAQARLPEIEAEAVLDAQTRPTPKIEEPKLFQDTQRERRATQPEAIPEAAQAEPIPVEQLLAAGEPPPVSVKTGKRKGKAAKPVVLDPVEVAPAAANAAVAVADDVSSYRQQTQRGSFSTKPLKAVDAPLEEQFLNFRRVRLSPNEEANLRSEVLTAVKEQGLDPKQVEPHAAIVEAARGIDESLVDHVSSEANLGIQTRAARQAMRQRMNALNREVVETRQKLQDAALPKDDVMKLEGEVSRKEEDLRNYIGQWAGIRSADGRNLAMHRIMADSTWDVGYWTNRARRSMGLPPGSALPDKVDVEIRKIIAAGDAVEREVIASVKSKRAAVTKPMGRDAVIEAAKSRLKTSLRSFLKEGPSAVSKEDRLLFEADPEIIALRKEVAQRKSEVASAKPSIASDMRVDRAVNRLLAHIDNKLAGKQPGTSDWALTPEEQKIVDADPRVQAKRRELARAMTKLDESGWLETATALRKAGLLTGVKTHLRNLGGNAAFQVMEEAVRIPSSMMDIALAQSFSGKRTTAGASLRAITTASRKAATKGVQEAADILKHGSTPDDLAKTETHRELNFKKLGAASKVINAYVNGVFRTLSAEDRIFRVFAAERSIQEQAKVLAMNEVRAGKINQKQMVQRWQELTERPTEPMSAQAIEDAEFATFNNKNWIAQGVSMLKGGIRSGAATLEGKRRHVGAMDAAESLIFGIDFVVPFIRTPANIGARLMDYSLGAPVKVGYHTIKALSGGLTPERQHAIAQAFGRGAVGWSLLLLGYHMASQGDATGTSTQAPGQKGVAEAAGRQYGSVKAGGKWHKISPLAPAGNLITMGASLFEKEASPKSVGMLGDVAKVGSETLLDQPMLQGPAEFIDALRSPERSGQRMLASAAASTVPTMLNDIGTMMDPARREWPKTPGEGFASRLPIAREALPVRRDVFGKPLESNRSAAVNPLLSSTAKEDTDLPMRELIRLKIGVTKPAKSKAETDQEYNLRLQLRGSLMDAAMREVVAHPNYGRAGDDLKAAAIKQAMRSAQDEVADVMRDERYKRAPEQGRIALLHRLLNMVSAQPRQSASR